ncbi:unnamed protein product, partial [Coccothraustes coccothraustes]
PVGGGAHAGAGGCLEEAMIESGPPCGFHPPLSAAPTPPPPLRPSGSQLPVARTSYGSRS